MLVLKQNAANTVPTPPAGKGTIFLTDNDDIAVKTNDGNVTTFPTVGGSNTQVFFNDEGAIGGSANMTFNKSTNVLTVSGNISATGVKTNNLYYANGNPWDLQQPGGSNTQLQFNDADEFGGSANLTFNKTTNTLALAGTANISEINTTGNVLVGGNLTVNGNVTYINVDTLNVEDPIISLGGGPNGSPLASDDGKDRGTALQYYSGTAKTAFMGWDNSNAEFGMGAVTTVTNDVVTFSTYGNLRVGNIIGNGQALSGLTGANVTGQVANALVAGTVYTNAQPNITSVGTLTTLLVGASALAADFPNAKVIVAQDNSGQTHSENIGLVGEAVADSGNTSTWGIGVLGEARANGATKATGVQGGAYVTNSADTGAAVGVRGYATMTHSGGYNIGVLGNAAGSGLGNYAFYVQSGNIASIETDTVWDLNDNSANALAFNSSGKANILRIDTTDSAEGVAMAGTLTVTGNSNVSNLGASGLITATGNVSGGNLTTGGVVSATGNVSGGNLTTAGVVSATGNVSGGNLTTAGALSVTGNANVGNIGVTHVVVTGNVTGNLLPSANVTYNLGSATQAWGELFLAGNTITLGSQTITANATAISLTGLLSGNGGGLNNLNASNLASGTVANARLSGTYTITVDGSANTVRDAAQANITSLGTLTGLGVNGTATAVNFTANTGVFTGNGAGLTNLAAGNISGQVANALVAGTVYTASQPNITSVGTLTSASVTGNVTAGNVYANSGTIGASLLTGTLTTAAQPNITSVGTLSSLTTSGNVAAGNLTTTGVLSVTGTGVSSIAGNLDMTSNTIINLATPTNPTDAATKQYVDDVAQGLNIHDACAAATPDTLANITSGTISYNNGSNGVGAYLSTTGTFNLIDGVNVQTSGTRILVKNEANAVLNGIYTYTNTTAITRATDFNSIPQVEAGDFTFVTGGTLYDNTGWVQTESPTGIGTAGNNISFTQFSGAGTYNAGTGLTLTGSTFSVNASQTQVTALGTVTSGTWNSLVGSSATFAAGLSGANLASITGANVTGTVPLATSATTAGTVTTAAQPNITSVGTLTSLGVSGAVTASTLVSNVATGTAPFTVTSTTQVANLNVATAGTAGTVTTAAQPNITSVGTLTSLGVNGTVTAVAFTANSGVFTGNANGLSSLQGANVVGTINSTTLGNSTLYVGTTAIALNRGTGAQSLTGITSIDGYAATVSTAAQPNITSVGTLTTLTVSGATSVTGNSALTTTNITSGANTTAGYMTGNWTLTAGSKFNATYADLAEKYVADADYEPGTVLVFGGEMEVSVTGMEGSTRVAGVVSTDPAYVMNAGCEGAHVVTLALMGRVPCKVEGNVRKGDLLVTSSVAGYAKVDNEAKAGTIIGKALQNFEGHHGIVEVVVGRV